MAIIINVREFVETHLKRILEGKTSLRCFFTTYRTVTGFRPGDVKVSKPGLSIRVSEGGNQSVWTFLPLLTRLDAEPMKKEAREQLATAIAHSGIPTSDDGHFLLVVYAGLSAFGETIRSLSHVRRQCPRATIVVVTCDCALSDKQLQLRPYVDNGTINFVTEGHGCGGYDEMAAILEGVIERWQPAEAT